MFQSLSELFFKIAKPFIIRILNKTGYPEDAIMRKQGIFPEAGFSNDDNVIMFHGVSVGEAVALENLVIATRKEHPESKIIVTTGTHTGQDIAHKKLDDIADLVTYFPLDCPSYIKRFLDKTNPKVIMIAETEIWPNFAIECHKRGIKLYIINGRISDSTFKTYDMFRFIFKPFLNLYSGIYTQSTEDNNKFLRLGANKQTTKRMNNLKFDIKKPVVNIDFNKGTEKILLAGSTHQGEDEIVIDVYKKLKNFHSNLKLILAPRHITRLEEIKNLLDANECNYALRSSGKNNMEGIDILVLDTMGELGKFYYFADVSFIGGSFNKTGGHNPLESIVFEKPVISGPSIHNFKDIYAIIQRAEAGFIVKTPIEFYEIANKLLKNADFYQSTVKSCTNVFNEQQGAMEFVLTNILYY